MLNSTSITYQMKREILTFSNKISRKLTRPEKKFMADMTSLTSITFTTQNQTPTVLLF